MSHCSAGITPAHGTPGQHGSSSGCSHSTPTLLRKHAMCQQQPKQLLRGVQLGALFITNRTSKKCCTVPPDRQLHKLHNQGLTNCMHAKSPQRHKLQNHTLPQHVCMNTIDIQPATAAVWRCVLPRHAADTGKHCCRRRKHPLPGDSRRGAASAKQQHAPVRMRLNKTPPHQDAQHSPTQRTPTPEPTYFKHPHICTMQHTDIPRRFTSSPTSVVRVRIASKASVQINHHNHRASQLLCCCSSIQRASRPHKNSWLQHHHQPSACQLAMAKSTPQNSRCAQHKPPHCNSSKDRDTQNLAATLRKK